MTATAPKLQSSPNNRRTAERRLLDAGIPSIELWRWHDGGSDQIALLVDDEDAAAARSQARRIGGATIHCLTSSGGKGGSFRLDNPRHKAITLAIFPYDLAQDLLVRSRNNDISALDRFRVAAYVVTYFGSFPRLVGLSGEADNLDLRKLATEAGLDPSLCRDRAALDSYFVSIGWRPSVDKLERLGLADQWIQKSVLPNLVSHRDVDAGLSIFFCRARAVKLDYLGTMQNAIEETGFEVLRSLALDGEMADQVYASTRGGNWGAGPFPTNGGPPVHLLIAVDVFPVEPRESLLGQHPFLDNERTLAAKVAARDAVFATLSLKERFNPMHSSDNSAEALRIAASVLSAAEYEALADVFAARLSEVNAARAGAPFLDGSNPVAARVSISDRRNTWIRKIYRRQYAKNAERAVALQTALSSQWPELPSILARDDACIDLAIPDEDLAPLADLDEPVPVTAILRLRAILQAIARAGFKPVGWEPGHAVFISDRTGKLFLPGFEMLEQQDEPFALPDLVPDNSATPSGRYGYGADWYPIFGVPRGMFLNGGPTMMRVYQRLAFPCHKAAKNLAGRAARLKAAARGWAKLLYGKIVRGR